MKRAIPPRMLLMSVGVFSLLSGSLCGAWAILDPTDGDHVKKGAKIIVLGTGDAGALVIVKFWDNVNNPQQGNQSLETSVGGVVKPDGTLSVTLQPRPQWTPDNDNFDHRIELHQLNVIPIPPLILKDTTWIWVDN